jgi:hypothetical protein
MSLPFEYTIKKNKRSKHIKIKIERGNQVVVSAPHLVPNFFIEQFVKKQQNWVVTHLNKNPQSPKFNTPESIFIFGKKYSKKLEFSLKKKIGVYVSGKHLIFNPTEPPKLDTAENKKKWQKKFDTKVDQFLINTAKHYIIQRTEILSKKMNASYNKLTLKKQKTRWGSCSSQKNLNFNWQLVYFEPKIIDYVIIHELAHLTHMDHSKNFWSLVEKYDPEYRKHTGWLKRNGLSLS